MNDIYLKVNGKTVPINIPIEVVYELNPNNSNQLIERHVVKSTLDLPDDYIEPFTGGLSKEELIEQDSIVFTHDKKVLESRITSCESKMNDLNKQILEIGEEKIRLENLKNILVELNNS